MKRQLRMPVMVVVAVAVFVFGVIVVGSAYTPVEPGTVVLIKRFGGLTGDVYREGLHWRIPFVDQALVMPIAIRSYETSDEAGMSNADYRDIPVTAQTVDGQQITIKYTVVFKVPPEQAVGIVRDIGPMSAVVENVVKANSRNLTRVWAQNYTAEDLYSGEGIFGYEYTVRDALVQAFEEYGVALDRFLVRKIDFDPDYIAAIEQQQIAQEAIETAQYQAEAAEYEKERQIRLAEADAERIKLQAAADAERTRLLAAADAERQRLLADAEAYSIETRGAALKDYPELVQWEFVRNLEGVQWGILPGEGITPFIPLPSFEGQEQPSVLPVAPGE